MKTLLFGVSRQTLEVIKKALGMSHKVRLTTGSITQSRSAFGSAFS
jgi:hypothetical protein